MNASYAMASAMVNDEAVGNEIIPQKLIVKQQTLIVSPEPLLASERGYIAFEHFMLVPIRPSFAKGLLPIYADPETMKYFTPTAETFEFSDIQYDTLDKAKAFQQQIPNCYAWGVINENGIYGTIYARRVMCSQGKSTYEVSRALQPAMQGRKQGSILLKAMFDYLPDVSWKGTVNAKNITSWKSEENAGFVFDRSYEEKGNIMKVYKRQSNYELEGNEKIHFTYSNKTMPLIDLIKHQEEKQYPFKRNKNKKNVEGQFDFLVDYENELGAAQSIKMTKYDCWGTENPNSQNMEISDVSTDLSHFDNNMTSFFVLLKE
ncbi:MAG: GNAT family protein [Candidatus Paracaedibacteraceae bacterium]|nr:GNAT family protein [Candidatus Paracaedibacteraceae bacterium]